MYAVLLPYLYYGRDADKTAPRKQYTYEEVNRRVTPAVNGQLPPQLDRDTYTRVEGQNGGGIRHAPKQQIAFFYSAEELGSKPLPSYGHLTGFHMLVGGGKSWTHSPRGIMGAFRRRRPIERSLPISYGSQVDSIGER
jgi:hypothetical protein